MWIPRHGPSGAPARPRNTRQKTRHGHDRRHRRRLWPGSLVVNRDGGRAQGPGNKCFFQRWQGFGQPGG